MTQFKTSEPASVKKEGPGADDGETHQGSAGSGVYPQQSLFEFPKKKRELTIILVGQTGGGKTAILSLLRNLFQGNGPLELVDMHNVSAESGLKASQSQTTKATLYSFNTSTGVKFHILDTPGLADTRGFDTDNANRENIHHAIVERIESIDAILVVANGGVARLEAPINYTLDILASLFPQSIVGNIGFIFTHTTDAMGFNFPISDLRPELQEATRRRFLLDNPLSLHKSYLKQSANESVARRELEKMKRRLELAYSNSLDCFEDLFEWLDKTTPQPTNEIIRLYELSASLEGRIQATLATLRNATTLRNEIDGLKRRSDRATKQKTSLDISLKGKPRRVWIMEDREDKNTICIASDCYSNCHLKCSLSYTESQMLGRWCNVFYTWLIPNALKWGNDEEVLCSKCQHPAKLHRNQKSIHKEVENERYKNIMAALERATTTRDSLVVTRGIIQEELDNVNAEIKKAKTQIQRLVSELNEISLTRNFAGRIRSGIQLLEVQRKELPSGPSPGIESQVIDEALTLLRRQLELIENTPGTVRG